MTTTIDIDNDNRQTTMSTIDIDNDRRQPTVNNDDTNDACNDEVTHDSNMNFNKQVSSTFAFVMGKVRRKPGPKEHLAREGMPTPRVPRPPRLLF